MAAALGIGRFVYTPLLPLMLEDLGLSKADGGLIASANFLGYLLGALGASLGALPGSRRTWLLAMLAASAVTTGAMALDGPVWVFAVLRFTGGVASAFVLIFSSALVLEWLAGVGRQGLSALHFAGVGIGIAFSATLVSVLGGQGLGWQLQWLACGFVSLLAVGGVAFFIPSMETEVHHQPAAATGGILNHPLLALVLAYGLFGFGYVITATFISTMVRSTPQLAPIEPVVWLTVGLAAVPSVAFWTWSGRRIGNSRSFLLACLVEAAGVVLSVLAINGAAVLFSAALLGGTFMGLTALGLIQAREISPGDPRRSLAFMTAAFGLGQMIGPAFAGFAYELTGSLRMPSLVAGGALLAAAGLVIITGKSSPALSKP